MGSALEKLMCLGPQNIKQSLTNSIDIHHDILLKIWYKPMNEWFLECSSASPSSDYETHYATQRTYLSFIFEIW